MRTARNLLQQSYSDTAKYLTKANELADSICECIKANTSIMYEDTGDMCDKVKSLIEKLSEGNIEYIKTSSSEVKKCITSIKDITNKFLTSLSSDYKDLSEDENCGDLAKQYQDNLKNIQTNINEIFEKQKDELKQIGFLIRYTSSASRSASGLSSLQVRRCIINNKRKAKQEEEKAKKEEVSPKARFSLGDEPEPRSRSASSASMGNEPSTSG
jgi:predicted nucleic acid-binding Zn finger protein